MLFLCTGNSARSIMAEGILNGKHDPHFTAFSAGSMPSGTVRPEALHQLVLANLPTENARSKSWDEFASPGAPKMDFVFTVCDNAAKEAVPAVARPAHDRTLGRSRSGRHREGTSSVIDRAFRDAFLTLSRRINLFLSLPLASLDQLALKKEIDRIGHQ